jgi:hypothetical protein
MAGFGRLAADRDYARLAAFAGHSHRVISQVEIRQIQSNEF